MMRLRKWNWRNSAAWFLINKFLNQVVASRIERKEEGILLLSIIIFGKHSGRKVRMYYQFCLTHFGILPISALVVNCLNISTLHELGEHFQTKTRDHDLWYDHACGRSSKNTSVSCVTNNTDFKLVWPVYMEPVSIWQSSDLQHSLWPLLQVSANFYLSHSLYKHLKEKSLCHYFTPPSIALLQTNILCFYRNHWLFPILWQKWVVFSQLLG